MLILLYTMVHRTSLWCKETIHQMFSLARCCLAKSHCVSGCHIVNASLSTSTIDAINPRQSQLVLAAEW